MLVPSLLLFLLSSCFCTDFPLVQTPLGTIRGHYKTSHDGRKFSAFEGIPFAKPPIGERRFEEAEYIEPWTGTWDANYLITCAQTTLTQPNVTEGVKDCLYINVYVPRETPNPNETLPVMVHIHGGAFMYGSGHLYANPVFLMVRELIFVTFNYRVGVLGFLSTEDETVPGNMGLKDQVLALKWIKNNIASFGGDPSSVTLTGVSSGGASVHLHYFSPLSKGLFHRGLSESGTATICWIWQKEALRKAKVLGESLGCPVGTTKDLIKCLKEKPLGQILNKVGDFYEYRFLPSTIFGPVVEKTGNGLFLTGFPEDLLKEGKVLDVPWIASNTKHEGVSPALLLMDDLDYINKNWDSLAPIFFEYNKTLQVSGKIRDFYLGENQILTPENSEKFVKMFSDRLYFIDGENSVKLQANTSKQVFYYFFTYLGDFNDLGFVGHGDDTKYIFGTSRPLTDNELKMKDVFMDFLTNFAKTGEVTIRGVIWEPTQSDQLKYINIGGFEVGDIKVEETSDLSGSKSFWQSFL